MLKMYSPQDKKQEFLYGLLGNKIHFISLGCPRNLVDTEVMLGILLQAGYEPTETLSEADYIIVNTCGFLKASRDESMVVIGECLKERKGTAKVIVTGCMVQTHSGQIKKDHPLVDYFLGSGDVKSILKAVEAEEQGEEITSAQSFIELGEVPRKISTPKHYAYLKIAEGCRKRCSYCIIPSIKGKLKSKPVAQVLKEFRALIQNGVKEVILIAQDLGDWGKDFGFKRSEGLVHLLKEILKEEGNFWLRLLYVYPDEITDELIDLMKSDSRICPYLDMPIQHINNDLLKGMRRATSGEDIRRILSSLRQSIPDIAIRTSLIVGFPKESKEQFNELSRFLMDYPLDHVGIFTFSPEEGSHAVTLPDQIDEKVKGKRQRRLASVQAKTVEKLNRKYLGKTLKVLVEGYHPDSPYLMRGRHAGQAPEVDGQVIINDCRGITAFGEWYSITITATAGYDLVGSV